MRFNPFRTIKSAFITCFSVLILLSLTVFYQISLGYTKETVLENSVDYTLRLVKQVNSDIDNYIKYMQNTASMMIRGNDIQEYFQSDPDDPGSEQSYERILTQFRTVIETREDISNVAAISRDGRYIINQGEDKLNPYVKLETVDWYRDTYDCEEYILTASHVQYVIDNNYKWVVTLSRPVFADGADEPLGVFFIDLNYKLLRDLCEQNNLGQNSYVFIIDEAGNIIYHPKQQLLFRNLTTERIEEVLQCEQDYFMTPNEEQGKLYTISKSEETGWSVVGVVSVSSLMPYWKETQTTYLLIAVILIFSGILLAFLLAGAITKPLKNLAESMQEVEKRDFKGASIEKIPYREIGALHNAFNVMTTRIHQLMEENVEEQRQKRKSELKALRSQINPHFLYNTLDSIIWMAEGGKNKEVVMMTSSLARLLRQSISNDEEMIPLRKEIDYTKSYLTIQKMRYKDKLEFSIEVDPQIQNERVVNLILQPIVENAIYHGIKPKGDKGMIRITGSLVGDDIVLEVMDNGVGISSEELAHIFDRSRERENEKGSGVGVYNVHVRLKLYYGEQYGLSFESKEGEGTKVTMRLCRYQEPLA